MGRHERFILPTLWIRLQPRAAGRFSAGPRCDTFWVPRGSAQAAARNTQGDANPFMMKQLFAKKPLHVLLEEMQGEHRLRRVLGPVQLTSLGVGAIIGTGIFVLTGHGRARQAPARR